MREITQFANYTVEIWRRPRQRHMHLSVRPDGRVRVTCNRRRSKREILQFVADCRGFIAKRALELELVRRRFPAKSILTGETILFLGRHVPLQLVWTWSNRVEVTERDDHIEILAAPESTPSARAAGLAVFLKHRARRELFSRVRTYSIDMGLYPVRVSLRRQSTRWGSCSARGEISLNMKLVCAPPFVMDYVVVHELAHIAHLNHSPAFWEIVNKFHGSVAPAKAWLKAHEPEISAQIHGLYSQ